ncbi:MAG: hypothetical protein AAF790_03905, partial [Planctomycetota bacterium]
MSSPIEAPPEEPKQRRRVRRSIGHADARNNLRPLRRATARRVLLNWRRPQPMFEHPWAVIAVGAGLVSPVIAVPFLLFLLGIELVVYSPTQSDFLLSAAAAVPVVGAMSFFGFLAIFVAAGATLPFIALCGGMLGVRVRFGPMACFCGGVVLSLVCVTLLIASAGLATPTAALALIAVATPIGQLVCGMYVAKVEAGPSGMAATLPRERGRARRRGARFSVRQLLVVMTIAGAALATLKATGLTTGA